MLKLRALIAVLGVSAVLAGPAVTAQTNGQPEEFNATAIVNNNLGAGAGRVIMRVTRWSTEAERGRLTRTLMTKGADLLDELRDMNPLAPSARPTALLDLR